MSMTKNKLRAKLDELGIDFSSDASKDDLQEMYDEFLAQEKVNDPPDDGDGDDTGDDGDIGDGSNDPGDDLLDEPDDEPETMQQATLQQCMNMLNGKKMDGSDMDEEPAE